MSNKRVGFVEKFVLKLDMNYPDDQLVFDKLERLSNEKRNSKIVDILFNYFKDPDNSTKTEQQMLNIIENMSKHPTQPIYSQPVYQPPIQISPSYITPEVTVPSKTVTSTPISEPVQTESKQIKLGELAPLGDFELNLDSLPKKEETEDEKSTSYLKNVFYKNTTEFEDEDKVF